MFDSCPLCLSQETAHYHTDKKRDYRQCGNCDLVFVPSQYHLNADAEKAEYALHQNHIEDEGYIRFLNRTAIPLIKALAAGSTGLDFGCGPTPVLATRLAQEGFNMAFYDLYFYHQPELLEDHYDFICSTEVIEHLSQPGRVISQLWQQIKPGGIMALMTKRVKDLNAFKQWHYKNDPTHISFFSLPSFEWLAKELSGELEIVDNDVVFLHKS